MMIQSYLNKKYILPFAILLIVIISWFGLLDKHSDKYTNDSIIQAGVAYAIARGVNGIVSVLQTGTIEGGIVVSGSIAIGEILDPINDLIERFSSVMSLALGSLVLQKILLTISVHQAFKLLILASGIVLFITLITQNKAAISFALRAFLIFIFIRFALVMVVALNSIVDEIFIQNEIANGTEELRSFRKDVVKLQNHSGSLISDQVALEESIEKDKQKVEKILLVTVPNIKLELADINDQLVSEEESLQSIIENTPWADRLNPFSENLEEDSVNNRISVLEKEIRELEDEIQNNEENVEIINERIEENEKRLAGESVGKFGSIKDKLSTASDYIDSLSLEAIEGNITDTVNNIFNLSVLFILKTILIPLGFLYLLLKVIKNVWNMDFTQSSLIGDESVK